MTLTRHFASPFRAPVNRRSREPALVTHSGRVAPHNTSARSRACWMVGFAIPMPEGIGRGANSGLLASAEAGRHGVERSGSLASDAKQGCPDIDAELVCRRGVGGSRRDHEEDRPWRSNALHSAPSRLTERPMNTT